ncbi:hypothetical protein IWW38_000582 [Coemansia aciculifera]|uniref:Uncharacterized protein n=1 Tax=Coemansia aciculifera TaxID=417176 RepID=A0ACC1M8S4_9FUNG|nr:hypothetical protein IWW38_000582 [Coemansia aciculifera]
MGKRKSSRKVVKKVQPKLDTTFDCVFCNHEQCIIVSMDKKNKVGNLKCKICSATYQAALSHLSDPIDVYSEWIDACDEASRKETMSVRASTTTTTTTKTSSAAVVDNRRRVEPNTSSSHRPGAPVAAAAANRYDDDDDDDDDDDRGYYGGGRQRDANGVADQLTDESDMDDF